MASAHLEPAPHGEPAVQPRTRPAARAAHPVSGRNDR